MNGAMITSTMIENFQTLCTATRRNHLDPAIHRGIDRRSVDVFFLFLSMEDKPRLRVESAHTLVVIFDRLTAEQQQNVRDVAIPVLLRMTIRSSDERARTKARAAVWEFANGDCDVRRNLILDPVVRGIMGDDPEIQRARTFNLPWILSAVTNPPIQHVVEAGIVPRLVKFVKRGDDPKLQFHAAQALCNIAEGEAAHTNVVVEEGAIPGFVSLLHSPYEVTQEAAARGLANIAANNSNHRDSVLQKEALSPLLDLLRHSTSSLDVLRAATSALANLCDDPQTTYPLVQQLMAAEVGQNLVQFLQRDDNPDLQYDAARVLKFVVEWDTEGDAKCIDAVVRSGVIPPLIPLLRSPNEYVNELAAWLLANIAENNPDHRDSILEQGAMEPLVDLLRHSGSDANLRRLATLALANLCGGKPQMSHPSVKQVVHDGVARNLVEFLQCYEDPDLQSHAVRAVCNIAAGEADLTKIVVDAGAIPVVVLLLSHPYESIKEHAARALSNIAIDHPTHRDLFLEAGAMAPLLATLQYPGSESAMLLAATAALSNLCCEPRPTLPPVQQGMVVRVLPRLVEFVQRDEEPCLQFGAALVLRSIAAWDAEHAGVIVDKGLIPTLVRLLHSLDEDVKEEAALGLANIARDNPNHRDLVLQEGAMQSLLALLDHPNSKLDLLQAVTRALSMLCRGEPRPIFELIRPAQPALLRLITCDDEKIVKDACWALSYLTGGSESKIEEAIKAGVCRSLVQLLRHASPSVQEPALLTLGHVLEGSSRPTQVILEQDLLPSLSELLSSTDLRINELTCWFITIVIANSNQGIQKVIEYKIVPKLIQLLNDSERDIRKQAAQAIWHFARNGTLDQIETLVAANCIQLLCGALSVVDPEREVVSFALMGLERIVEVGWKISQRCATAHPIVSCMSSSKAEVILKLKELRRHRDKEICNRACDVLEHYFDFGVDDDGELAAVTETDGESCDGESMEPPRKRPRLL